MTFDLAISSDSDSFADFSEYESDKYLSSGVATVTWLPTGRMRFVCLKAWRQLSRRVYPAVKRALDVAAAATLLVLATPLFVALAIAIKATDGGPVLFWQTRVGQWGRRFWFPKFRSMVPNAEARLAEVLALNHHKTGVTFKLKDDPRLTRVGRLMRRTSLDELPQLWSVLVGDMTLVGPRPAVPREVSRYTLDDRRRLEVAPGLTCIWQVSGRSDIPFARQLEMDIEYIERRSLLLDFKLLAKTVPAVLSGRGAY